ncbi:hypothetical protein EhVM1_000174 [Emiliania huxleyi virus M1]|nr:hypothetical protein EhVM1_000174 [Emiliania huxleyi virus M1]
MDKSLFICLPDDIQRLIFFKIVKNFTETRLRHKHMTKMKNLLVTSACTLRVYRDYNDEFNVEKCVTFIHQWGPLIHGRAQRQNNE